MVDESSHNRDLVADIEHRVMKMLLDGDHAVLSTLRSQYAIARIVGVAPIPNGVQIAYFVPVGAKLVVPAQLLFGDVFVRLRGCVSFVLAQAYVDRGRLDKLDLCLTNEEWPARPVAEQITYTTWRRRGKVEERVPSARRDLKDLGAALAFGQDQV